MKIIIITLLAFFICACSNNEIDQALGTLERDRIVLKATASEIITALPLRESSKVKQGDLVVQLDTRQQQAFVAKATANLTSKKALLSKLHHGARIEDIAATRAQVERAEAQRVQSEKIFERAAILASKHLTSPMEIDNARAQRDSARADKRRAEQNLLVLTHGSRAEDLTQAEAFVAEAEAALAVENYKLEQLRITATRNGVLDRLPKYLGERTNVGEAVAILLVGDAPYARVYIPEPARSHLNLGQVLTVKVDGYAKTFAGKLRWVSQDPAFTPYYALNSTDRARLVYLAEIDLPPTANDLPSGLPLQVDLHTQENQP
jgi:HlyD family secretion protein